MAQLAVAIAAGLALAILIVRQPIPFVLVALVGAAYGLVFLGRPDIGLMIVLLVRTSTDLSLRFMGTMAVGGFRIAGLLNTGLVLVVIVAGGLFVLKRSLPIINLPGGKLLVLMLLIGAVGVWRSNSMLVALDGWLPVVALLIVYSLAAALFRSPQRMRLVIDAFAVSFVVPALFGFYQIVSGTGGRALMGIGQRFPSTFVHPAAFGNYLVMMLSVFLPQVLSQTGLRRLVAVIIVLASVPLLVGTYARAAWVGALIVLLTVSVRRSRALLVLVAVLGVMSLVLVPSIPARLTDPLSGSLAWRVGLWRDTVDQWVAATAAEGSAVGTALARFTGLAPGDLRVLTLRARERPWEAHNDYLRILAEYGLLGLSLYIALFVVLARLAFRVSRESSDKTYTGVALALQALTLAIPIMSLTDNIFTATVHQIYFYTLAGMTVAAGDLSASEADARKIRASPPRLGPNAYDWGVGLDARSVHQR